MYCTAHKSLRPVAPRATQCHRSQQGFGMPGSKQSMLSSVVPFSLPTPLPGLWPEPDTMLFATNTPFKNKRKHCTETGSYLRLLAIQRPSAPSQSWLVPMSTTKTKPASNPSYGHTAQGQLPRCSGMTRRAGDTEFVLLLGLQHKAWGGGQLRTNSKRQPHSCSSVPMGQGWRLPMGLGCLQVLKRDQQGSAGKALVEPSAGAEVVTAVRPTSHRSFRMVLGDGLRNRVAQSPVGHNPLVLTAVPTSKAAKKGLGHTSAGIRCMTGTGKKSFPASGTVGSIVFHSVHSNSC